MTSSSAVAHGLLAERRRGPSLLPWWLAYVAFVIYGSLVPLDYRPVPWGEAWEQFRHIHLLDVGAGGRADWVANGVLYVPVGFLTASLLAGSRRARLPLAAMAGAVGFAVVLALAVEFAQLAFPPRTVSLNDVLAEFMGGGLGAALAGVAAERFRSLLTAMREKVDHLIPQLLAVYALAYGAFSLFPYDFLLSAGELADKFHSDSWGWLWASGGGRGGEVAAVAKMVAEALATMPLGWLLAGRGCSPRQAWVAGAALGAVIEFAQFFLVSGVAQGFSVLTRAVGLWGGALAWQRRDALDPLLLAAHIRRFGLLLAALYILGLVAVTGWFELPWKGPGAAADAFREVRFLPFYYHYYTTEQAALLSLTSVALMYAPVGVLAWACFLGPATAAVLAVVAALGIEISKLFLVGLHPDPTNLLLAGVAAWGACRLAQGTERLAASTGSVPTRSVSVAAGPTIASPAPERTGDLGVASAFPAVRSSGVVLRTPRGMVLMALVMGLSLAGWGVVRFPLQPVLLGLGLAGYGVTLWFRPHGLWLVVPAALPLLDLAPWSGRFFFDEFDLLMLVSVAVGYARVAPVGRRTDKVLRFVLILVGASYGVATLRGLLPWQMPDVNAFNNYYSPFNALRMGKGALWAFLLHGLWGRFARAGAEVGRLFARGMVVGLAGTVTVVVWERMAFPGLLDFASVYRVTGPFSQMHTGGADIESYLTVATPFLVMLLLERRVWVERILGLILLVATAYAVMVTFSRAGYAGFAVALVVALTPRLWSNPSESPARPWLWRGAALAVVVVASLAVVLPILRGSFAQERIARTGEDLLAREAHWRETLAMRDPGLGTQLFGMGLGRFPQTHYWRSREARAAGYGLGREGDGYFLRLGSGSPLYVEQFVDVQPSRDYVLSLKARGSMGAGRLAVSLCEKWLLTSARCASQTLDVPPGQGWRVFQAAMAPSDVGSSPWYAARPVKFSISNASAGAVVDVDQVELKTRDGTDLLANGGFSEGLDRWFFSADVDLPWHVWSLPVAVLFDQGWMGVVALATLIVWGFGQAVRRLRSGDPVAGAWLGAISGCLVLGLVDSLIDSPRCLMLLLILLLCGRGFGETAAARP